jgi:hypothetical protein
MRCSSVIDDVGAEQQRDAIVQPGENQTVKQHVSRIPRQQVTYVSDGIA